MDYKNLDVWKKCRKLADSVYEISKSFPKEEIFGLTIQIRRAAVSVVSNIAEGCGRQHSKDAIQIFYIARGSLYEVETQLYVALDQNYIKESVFEDLILELVSCKQMLNGLIKYFKGL
ncbi:four helix bundle protein [Pontibacter aydingkolensis]|uniref:Four helix bundle protein n=1 Tax=Pontibacter aydingkolensis TaxID=1911536 RepID=A0ABS7CW81_9BACT|nr:four helix bundle protein [Pontibacter aydingkolensis]MBW7468119.1 four helix bundle protein [Pontibacter aydingkolensis]